jgi:hypothetical protein
MRRALLLVVLTFSVALTLGLTAATAGLVPIPDFPIGKKGSLLTECAALKEQKQRQCYVSGLLKMVEASGDPASELPEIDKKVRSSGGFLASNCHILMHEVGRTFARRHDVTLETMYRYVPKSNDPGCSAGFGMGMVMHLGAKLVLDPRGVLSVCTALPTRFREYTCVHGSGHAFMRGYHGLLAHAVEACKKLGPRFTPDCAQGAFHDYWISLGGGDGTTRPKNADLDPKTVCGRFSSFARPCWYRFFWERRQAEQIADGEDMAALCQGLKGMQRAGCIGGASLLLARGGDPVLHTRACVRLAGPDALNCLRGVNVPVLAGNRFEQLRLLRTCSALPESTRGGCYSWFGRTLNVVTNGRFEKAGCSQLGTPLARASCVAGARKLGQALGTFA